LGELGEAFVIYRKISSKRQVFLGKKILKHLGVKPGGEIDCELRQDGRIVLMASPKNRRPSIKENP
jgi:bifunctional DNA-binding transcriptional regulator/antitoxin component of YhaV-PrlF toxin-antitoxin module